MDLAHEPHILAIGEALIDIVTPISHPEDAREIPGGSPANVAMTLGRLGRPSVLSTWFANDPRGKVIEEHFTASHVVITPESRGAHHTTTALASIDDKGAATYTFDFDWNPTSPIPVSDQALVVHAGSISAAVQPGADTVYEALKAARPHALITFDPNARPAIMGSPEKAMPLVEKFVAVSDVIKVSDEDLEWLTNGEDLDHVVARWLDLGPLLIIVTRGKKGGLAVSKSGVRVEATPGDVKVVDTVGAGDSFMGGILDAMWGLQLCGAEGRATLETINADQVQTILDRASRISDVTVSRAGANPPWSYEID